MLKTITFTGSRPNKLWGYNLNHSKYSELRSILRDKLIMFMNNSDADKFHFIVGGALGFDTISAQVVLKLRELEISRQDIIDKFQTDLEYNTKQKIELEENIEEFELDKSGNKYE
ncbi:MAG: SLOG family protein [Clostridium sp.]